jgi:hypothetical protein
MGVLPLLQKMHTEGTLSAKQLDILSAIHLKKRFSLQQELRGLIYAGVILVILGAGLTIKAYFQELGHIAIISSLSFFATAALVYCFFKGVPYTSDEVPSPNIGFDYILLLGCSLYSMDIAYVEAQFHLLGDGWDSYLLISAILFFYLAYRFDNRLVLSFALGTLAAWFGFKLNFFLPDFWYYQRLYAIAFGLLALATGTLLHRLEIKRHFLDIYLNFALHFLFIALVSGVSEYGFLSLYFAALFTVDVAVVLYALRERKFLYFLYAVLYGYVAISHVVTDPLDSSVSNGWIFTYFIASSVILVWLMVKISRRFKETP